MTPEQKQHWRYTFAGQIFIAGLKDKPRPDQVKDIISLSIGAADALLAALEASGVKECEHEWRPAKPGENPYIDGFYMCKKCGEPKT